MRGKMKDLGEKILDMLVEEINKQEDVDKQELIADIYQKAGQIVFDHDEKRKAPWLDGDGKDETIERENNV